MLVNPPRRGLDGTVMEQLKNLPAGQLIYMSCNPHSFASNAGELCAAGWNLGRVHAHDMLPRTTHVELIARFVRPGRGGSFSGCARSTD